MSDNPLQKLKRIRGYADTELLITAHNELIDAHNALLDIIEAHGQMLDALARPILRIAPADPRQTFVNDDREAQPL